MLQARYRIEHLVARSGMGAVYRATDLRFGNTVALKQVLAADHSVRDDIHQAFEREARLLNKLRHPSLPVVHDYFETGEGGQYLVMQFIEGDDLGQMLRLKSQPFPIVQVSQWADELLDALEYLHGQDPPVIHRDIKPANLKLTAGGRVCLLDFGLAKDSGGQSIYGFTKEYAPYEQIQGEGTDPRTDLYSLAASLYTLVTGKLPPDALARARSVMSQATDPLKLAHLQNPKVPLALAGVLNRALAINPDDRFPSASEMRAGLVAAVRERVENLSEISGAADDLTVVRAKPRRVFINLVSEKAAENSQTKLIETGDGHEKQALQATIDSRPPATLNVADEEGRKVLESATAPGGYIEGEPEVKSHRSPVLAWSRRLLLVVLIIVGSIYALRAWKIIQAYDAFKQAAQLAALQTDDARRKALDKYVEALALCRAGKSSIGEADTLRSIGRVHYELGDKKTSLEYYNQALSIYQAKGDYRLQAETLQNIGLVYSDLGNNQKAQSYYQMAQALSSH
ncbi:MAG TPA: serine/threonine-protein kinase [Blastocatellia bacterium]|nr:serine/threonine-protein kinase [Blastocatellia bacterium]